EDPVVAIDQLRRQFAGRLLRHGPRRASRRPGRAHQSGRRSRSRSRPLSWAATQSLHRRGLLTRRRTLRSAHTHAGEADHPALAYGMADGHRRIAIFDEGDRAFRASRGNFGLVWVQGKGVDLSAYAAWTRLSASLWPELANLISSDTGIDVALDQPGGLHLCL